MKKRGKTVELNLKVVMPTTCAKFRCRGAWDDDVISGFSRGWHRGNRGIWHNHKIAGSTTLTVCPELYCQAITCTEHTDQHREWHTLNKLGGGDN